MTITLTCTLKVIKYFGSPKCAEETPETNMTYATILNWNGIVSSTVI